MILAIDSGNTLTKFAVYEDDKLIKLYKVQSSEVGNCLQTIAISYGITEIVLAVVGRFSEAQLKGYFPNSKLWVIHHDLKFPFKNAYTTPHTLGIDRMVLAAGAVLKYPKQNRLVIDIGSCITYDYITANDEYLGGAISPGIRMRYEAMHEKTAKLPLLEKKDIEIVIGNSTEAAMHSGVINALVFEIQGFIDDFVNRYDNFSIILTGGDSFFFVKRLKSMIFAHSNFLLESLINLYIYQHKQ